MFFNIFLLYFPLLIGLKPENVNADDVVLRSNLQHSKDADGNLYQTDNKVNEKIKLQLYYEVFCPSCRNFYKTNTQTVLELSDFLEVYLYPYGNAKTEKKGNDYVFTCQHGPEECYGNKLHACGLDAIGTKNMTASWIYTACLMSYDRGNRGSDDEAVEACAPKLGLDPALIKQCAKGNKGSVLLNHYGEESKKANFKHVPYDLINGKVYKGTDLKKDLCAIYKAPPPPCANA